MNALGQTSRVDLGCLQPPKWPASDLSRVTLRGADGKPDTCPGIVANTNSDKNSPSFGYGGSIRCRGTVDTIARFGEETLVALGPNLLRVGRHESDMDGIG